MTHETLWKLGEKSIRELEVDLGILASSKSEIYGCVFGRDSLITAHKLIRVYERTKDDYYLLLVRKILRNLAALQGTTINIESGEEPGKIIHEYRTASHEHLTAAAKPWYLYPDKIMRNFDTVDATPLYLLTIYRYQSVTGDSALAEELMPSIRAALEWIMKYGDTNGDGLIDYWFHPDRKFGGLQSQSWMDSEESVFFERMDQRPAYPIAPVEVQAYTFAALRAWGDYFETSEKKRDIARGKKYNKRALGLKKTFNEKFVLRGRSGRSLSLAFAIDGKGVPLIAPRSSMGHALWAVYHNVKGEPESVLALEHIPAIKNRLLSSDLFVRRAGVRTLSSRSKKFDAMSYHNGSIWPHDTAIFAEGLANFGYHDDATKVRSALLRAYKYFATPVELFSFTGRKYRKYEKACQVQAWSAASILLTLSHAKENEKVA